MAKGQYKPKTKRTKYNPTCKPDYERKPPGEGYLRPPDNPRYPDPRILEAMRQKNHRAMYRIPMNIRVLNHGRKTISRRPPVGKRVTMSSVFGGTTGH